MSRKDVIVALDGAREVAAGEAGASPRGFRMTERGVELRQADDEWRWLCSPLEVLAQTRDQDGGEWGLLLRLVDQDGGEHLWPMPRAALAGDGQDVRAELFARGLQLASGAWARAALSRYLAEARQTARARTVARIGWLDAPAAPRFVLPETTIAGAGQAERVILQANVSSDHRYAAAGDLAAWRTEVAELAIGNSRLLFALSAAFAGPLLYIADAEGGGFHFRGGSSSGKSTALAMAGSVWGGGGLRGFVRQWRATDNALEALALGHNDTLLCLDEISQVDPRSAGAIAYMLANGRGKARASRDGSGRRIAEWRSLFLSSGEIGLADKMAEGGVKAAAGVAVRVTDIPADAGAGMGLFEQLHGVSDPGAFAQRVRRAATARYGVAGPAFVAALIHDVDQVREALEAIRARFAAEVVPAYGDGQVRRVADRFALVAAAGELAVELGVLPWPKGAAREGARRCFAAWLEDRGGAGPAEAAEAISRLRAAIETHGAARFEPWDVDPRRAIVIQRLGFVRRRARDEHDKPTGPPEFYVTASGWAEIMEGLDVRAVNANLIAAGVILPAADGRSMSTHKPPSHGGAIKLYRVAPTFLAENDPPEG